MLSVGVKSNNHHKDTRYPTCVKSSKLDLALLQFVHAQRCDTDSAIVHAYEHIVIQTLEDTSII